MEKKKPTVEDANKKIDLSLDNADQLRREGLAKLGALQRFKQRASVVERRRLTAKYGAEHPRVRKVEAKLKFNEGFIRDINVEKDKADIAPPVVSEDTWLVHGRLLDQNNTGITGLTVSLFNKKKKWVSEIGFACTDERGYFAITYPKKDGSQVESSEPRELFLTVTDQDNQILHQENEPVFVTIGQIDYREVVLSDPETVCTPPEPDSDEGEEPALPSDAWIVRGSVRGDDGEPAVGVTISVYDKDLFFDDALGTTTTDNEGAFHLIYRKDAFRDLFEKRPDLYVKVFDAKGTTLYSSRKAVRCEAGRKEVFEIKLKRR